jgi:hypothetical protein
VVFLLMLWMILAAASRVSQTFAPDGESLTLAFIVDAPLGLGLELSPDVVEQLVQALRRAHLGPSQCTGWRVAVVHRRGLRARVLDGVVVER